MPKIAIGLLGGFAATVDGAPVPERAWRLKKARELVKLLALAPGHRLHREQAMDALWPDRDPAAAANNLNQAVHVARRALGPDAIDVRDESLLLTADVDVEEFGRAATAARRTGTAAAYRAALSLYRGELLPENRYDDWAALRRDELAQLCSELAGMLDALGSVDGLHGLPTEASSFIGRDRELTELRSLLGHTRLLTLVGAGGAGKTRLALELARGAEASYASGAALVELAPVSDPSLVVNAAAAALDVRGLPGRPLVDALVDFLKARTLLMVLDNCEHVIGAGAALADALLRAAPKLTILATSREPLRVAGEVVFRVPSLDIPDPEQPQTPMELLRYEAVRLFVERATSAAPGFDLDDDNALDVARICFRLDGLPLALELAAGRLGALGPASIAERLDDRFRLLRAGGTAAPTRQQTLAATLQWSHDLLDREERTLLRRLAVFAGGFDLEAAETVCSGEGLAEVAVADLLARLVEKSLVAADEGSRERRYRLLETVRLYARERLDEAGETGALGERHARWALALAERERDLTSLDREAANLRAAFDNLMTREPREALRLCVALWPFWLRRIDLAEASRCFADALDRAPDRTPLRADALLAAATIEMRSGSLARGGELVEESLEVAAELGDPRLEWRALHFLGAFAFASDEGAEATRWLERGLELARREGLAAAEATCVYSLGVARWILGDLPGADDLLGRSIDLFRELADSTERVPSPTNIAEMRTGETGDRPLRLVFEETLQPFVEIPCDAAVSYVLANQAGVARTRGDLVRARALLEEAGARFDAAGDERGEADVLARRAFLDLAEGSLEAAREGLEHALRLRRRLNDRRGVGLLLAGLGRVDTAAGEHDRAERHVAEACDIFRRAGDRWGLVSSLWRAADLAFARGSVEEAEAALEEARAVVSETGRDRWIGYTLAGLAEASRLRGDGKRAAALLAEARERFAARGDAAAVSDVEARLRAVAKSSLSARKERPSRTASTRSTKGRRT